MSLFFEDTTAPRMVESDSEGSASASGDVAMAKEVLGGGASHGFTGGRLGKPGSGGVAAPGVEEAALEKMLFGDAFADNFMSSSSSEESGPDVGASGHQAGRRSSDDSEESSSDSGAPKVRTRKAKSSATLAPAWEDEDDGEVAINLTDKRRLRKLRKHEGETVVRGGEYVSRLRAKFQDLSKKQQGGGASWAVRALEAKLGHGSDDSSGEDTSSDGSSSSGGARRSRKRGIVSDGNSVDTLLRSSRALIKKGRGRRLAPGSIHATRATDLNTHARSKGVVRVLEYHPNGQLALTAGYDKTLRLFQCDGSQNQLLQSVHLTNFPVATARFILDGNQIVAAGRRKHFYVYDVAGGAVNCVEGIMGRKERSFEKFEASPDGNLLAFLGNHGTAVLVDAHTKQWAGNLKMNGSLRVAAFSSDSRELLTAGEAGEVYVWDIRQQRCRTVFRDHGSVRITSLAVSPNGKRYAVGSDMGVVNIYDAQAIDDANPKPLKAVMNLTTAVDTLRFHPSSQLLVMASRMKRDSVKLLHMPSLTVYSNWPTRKTPIRSVHSAAFNPDGTQLAVGNDRGHALLFQLGHWLH